MPHPTQAVSAPFLGVCIHTEHMVGPNSSMEAYTLSTKRSPTPTIATACGAPPLMAAKLPSAPPPEWHVGAFP